MPRSLIAIVALVLLASTASAQPVPVTWRPPLCSGSGQALTWNGTSWQCGVLTNTTGTGTIGAILKFSSVSVVADSLLTDNGTTLSYATNKLTVAAASGNTAIAGTLGVTGLLTATAGVTTPANLTTTSTGALSIAGASTLAGSTLTLGTASTTVHVTQLDTSARPTLTNCGTGAAIVGNDASWKLTTGTGAGSCTVTFNQAYSANASCTVTPHDGTPRAITLGTTTLAFTAVTDSTVYSGECREH